MDNRSLYALSVALLSLLSSCGGREYQRIYRSPAPNGSLSFNCYGVYEKFRLINSDAKSIGYTYFLIEGEGKVRTLMGDEAGEQSIPFVTSWWSSDSSHVHIVYCDNVSDFPKIMTWDSQSGEVRQNLSVELQFGEHVQREYALPSPPPLSWACSTEAARRFNDEYVGGN